MHINYVALVEDRMLVELMSYSDETRASLVEEITSVFGSYDTFSLIFTDAHDEIMDKYLDVTDELQYFYKHSAFSVGRMLIDEYGIVGTLAEYLNTSICGGLDAVSDFITPEDVENKRFMDPKDGFELPAMMAMLSVEMLSRTQEEILRAKEPKSPDPA